MDQQSPHIVKHDTPEKSINAPLNETEELNLIRRIVRDLEHYGLANDSKIPTPNIVMVGDQSSGKSSLVEAISQIRVPRDTGTCTRVPLEINLTKDSGEWTASVSLLQKYEYLTNKKGVKRKDAPLYPWVARENPALVHFMDVTAEKSDSLSSVIRWAQHALLNPSTSPNVFIERAQTNEPVNTDIGVGFSPNPIIVDIRGPNLPNLSFKDLPGVVAQASDKDGGPDAVEMIKRIATLYAKADNTLVVLVVSMETDVDVSSSSGLVSKLRLNDSCLGVLTKPDRLASLNVQQWIDVLEGRKYPRGLGYFVTKQPANVNVSYQQAREEETEYFGSENWISRFGDVVGLENRVGTVNLQRALAIENERMIRKHLPDIFESVRDALLDTTKSLEKLPVPKDPMSEIRQVVQQFEYSLRDMVSQDSKNNPLKSALKTIMEEFEQLIMERKKPEFRHMENLHIAMRTKFIVIDEDETDNAASSNTVRSTTSSPKKRAIDGTELKWHASFSPQDIRRQISNWDFVGNGDLYNPRVIDELLRSSIEWAPVIEHYFHQAKEAFFAQFKRLQRNVCRRFHGCKIEVEMASSINNYIERFLNNQCTFAMEHYRRELVGACARNKSAKDNFKGKNQKEMLANRQEARAVAIYRKTHNTHEDPLPTNFKEKLRKDLGIEKFNKQVESEPYEREIEVMAVVKAYYNIAATRFVELMWMGLHADLKQLAKEPNLFAEMISKANQDVNYAALLLEQDSVKLAKRASLLEKQEKLTKIWEDLNTLQLPARSITLVNRGSEEVEMMDEEDDHDHDDDEEAEG